MKHEKLKTFILSFLIVSSLILSAYLWFSEELWPSGYNFFASLRQNRIVQQLLGVDEPYSVPKENLSKPRKIAVTNGSERYVYYNTDEGFDRIFAGVKSFITEFLTSPSMVTHSETVSEEEWYNVLRNDEIADARSIYMSYSLSFSPSLFARVTGVKTTWLSDVDMTMRDFIIAPLSKDGEDMIFYIRDTASSAVRKYYVKYKGHDIYSDIINAGEGGAGSGYLFAYELNLHKSGAGVGTGVSQKVFLDPLVLVSPEVQETPLVKTDNPLSVSGDRQKLLSAFSYSPTALKKYTDAYGTEHYVDKYSTLKIYKSGLVEYESLDPSRGIKISDSSSSFYELLNSSIEFSEEVWHSIFPGKKFDVLVTSNLVEDRENAEISFTLDYYSGGNPVSVNLGAPFNMKNGIEITVRGGNLIRYRHLIRRFDRADETASFSNIVDALNGIYNLFNPGDEVTIEDIYVTYKENGVSDILSPVWCVKISGTPDPVFYTPR